MRRPLRPILRLAALLLAVAASSVACAPPGDASPETPPSTGTTAEEQPSAPEPATEDAGETSAAPRAAEPSDAPRAVVLQKLRGGVFVPRCPECGETQPDGAASCAGCGQELAPWRHEAVCPECDGSGSCMRCGDDRPCLACETSGDCPDCGGARQVDGARCDGCRGRGRCSTCRGDGLRSSSDGDFPPGASFLPGICTTCVDGWGLCPTCGGAEPDCATCAGEGRCPDCRGEGACPWDRGDGLCATCDGAGSEVVNGPPGTPAARRWLLRRHDGARAAGRVAGVPRPDVTLMVRKGANERALVLVPSKVHPVSYVVAMRDFTPLDDVSGRLALADAALERGMLSLARRELRRARALAPERGDALRERVRQLSSRHADAWMAAGRLAAQQGDRERAALLWSMIPAVDPESAPSARVALDALRAETAREEAGLDAAHRERARATLAARLRRTTLRARRFLERARRRLSVARDAATPARRARVAFGAADDAARSAEALVRADGRRARAAEVAWDEPPEPLLETARKLRAEIAHAQAVAEVAAGRFEVGHRLARIADALAPGSVPTKAVLEVAERGMMRRGVRVATPPPETE